MNPYPYPTADRIVRLTVDSVAGSGDPVYLNGAEIQTLRQSPVVESVLASDNSGLMLTGQDLPEAVYVVSLISNNFQDLGVPALLGRGLWPSDAVDGQDPRPVAVLSYRFWRKHYLSNPDVVGRTLQLDHRNFEIVGVAAPRFTWGEGDVYLPLKLMRDPGRTSMVDLLLRPGVSHAAADAALQPLVEQFAKYMPNDFPDVFKIHVQGLNDRVAGSMGGTLYLLFAAVMLLLVIGCGNVSILLLARGTARQHELAVRAAIGAGRHPDHSPVAYGLSASRGDRSRAGSYNFLRRSGADSESAAPIYVRIRGYDPYQPAGPLFQRHGGAGNGCAVRALAGVAALAYAHRGDHAVWRSPLSRQCPRTQGP